MKNLIKLMGIIAIVAVIVFAFVACPEPEEEGDPTSFGDKLEFTNEQVYVLEQKREGDKITFEFKPYTGDGIAFDSVFGATPKIVDGKFSFSVGVPPVGDLSSDLDLGQLDYSYYEPSPYTNVKANDPTVKSVSISSFSSSRKTGSYDRIIYSLRRENYDYGNITVSGSGENMTATGSATTESVLFVYVDKDVTITGKGSTSGGTIYNDINLSLSAGWNTVCTKMEMSISATSYSSTYTMSVSNPSSAKWVLYDNSND